MDGFPVVKDPFPAPRPDPVFVLDDAKVSHDA